MLYKTIALELLQQHTSPVTTPLLGRYSAALAESHAEWTKALAKHRPESDPAQLSGEALELALRDLKTRLEIDFPSPSPFNLDDAMAFVKRHTPAT